MFELPLRHLLKVAGIALVVGAACAKATVEVPTPTCTGAEILCSNVCTDTQADTENCGACGVSCGAGQSCVAGACATSCPAGDAICKSGTKTTCVNQKTDNANCGACGNTCKSGQVCFAGVCGNTCGDAKLGQAVCGGDAGAPYCANLQNDNANCGKCGKGCGNGQVCSGGACLGACTPDQTACVADGGAPYCANLQSDNAHCGDCNVACGSLQACVGGACVAQCTDTQITCTPDGGAPYCTDYLSDNGNCGKCGNVCPANKPLCSGGTCNDGLCNKTALLLGDTNASSNAAYVSLLQGVGFTVNQASSSTTYAGVPAASAFGVVVLSPGTTYTSDMPVAGQQSIANALTNGTGTGLYATEWFAYEIQNARYGSLSSLLLFARSSGNTAGLTFTNTQAHPIWTGLPQTFTTQTLGTNVGSVLNAGAVQIASCTQCTSIGVAVRDQGKGRIVQVAHAAGYSGTWWTDPNLAKLFTNSALWAARCN